MVAPQHHLRDLSVASWGGALAWPSRVAGVSLYCWQSLCRFLRVSRRLHQLLCFNWGSGLSVGPLDPIPCHFLSARPWGAKPGVAVDEGRGDWLLHGRADGQPRPGSDVATSLFLTFEFVSACESTGPWVAEHPHSVVSSFQWPLEVATWQSSFPASGASKQPRAQCELR